MNYRIGRSGGTLGSLNYYLEGEHLESVEQTGMLTEKYFRGSTIDELVAGYVRQGRVSRALPLPSRSGDERERGDRPERGDSG